MIESGSGPSLRCTLVTPACADASVDVTLSSPMGTRWRDLHPALVAAGWPPEPAFVDGSDIDDATVGSPPLLHGAVITLGHPGGSARRAAGTSGPLLEIHVTAGPDAGLRLPLSRTQVRVGRGTDVDLRLADPDVSRLHAEIVRHGSEVLVRDLDSTNGTCLAGTALDRRPRVWRIGRELQVGDSALRLRAVDARDDGGGPPASTHPDGRGRLLVNTAPRLPSVHTDRPVSFPTDPGPPPRSRPAWAGALLPLVVVVPLAWWLGQPLLLAFALLSPLTLLGQQLYDRRRRRADEADRARTYREHHARARNELAVRLAQEADRLLLRHPDLATTGATAATPLHRVWERRADDTDSLRLRLGLGEREATTIVDGDGAPDPPILTNVPVTADLRAAGVTGIAGPRGPVVALARSLVGQAAVWHSPRILRIVVLTATGTASRDWTWTTWLPHAGDGVPGCPPDPDVSRGAHVLVVLDGAPALRRHARVASLLASAAASGAVALCLADTPEQLPAECDAAITLGDAPGRADLIVRGAPPVRFRPDLASAGWAERLARDLARLRDSTPDTTAAGLPDSVRLVDLLARPPDASTPGADASPIDGTTADGWRQQRRIRASATTACLGLTADGPWLVDLRRDGPHVLVAGTTGAGKSELLTTLVVSLAAAHPPDRLHFVLFDYKGGTAFGPLAALPHVAAVVTDLDAAAAQRALTSLRAELRRREALLRSVGAADADGYEAARSERSAPLARLVIVVDEFRVLADELPDLLGGLVRVATVGRSLGVHLVLATQRPAGAVTAQMRANVNLRIALRVQDEAESADVLDVPHAARLPPALPGRGLFRSGGGPPTLFQAARATGVPRAARSVRVAPALRDPLIVSRWRDAPVGTDPGSNGPGSNGPGGDRGPDDLTVLVDRCVTAARRVGLVRAPAPWLPPLPARITPSDLGRLLGPESPGPDSPGPIVPGPTGNRSAAPGRLLVGIVDLPDELRRAPLFWEPARQGHLAVVGAPGSGRTGALRAIAAAATIARTPWHVHVLDGGGALAGLAGLPTVGTVAPVDDIERVDRLLAHLDGGHREHDGAPTVVPTVLLVDDWERALTVWYSVDHGRIIDDLLLLARRSGGPRLAVTGGRTLTAGPIAGVLTTRWFLRPVDPTDLVMAGVPASAVPSQMPAGRVVLLGGGWGRNEDGDAGRDGGWGGYGGADAAQAQLVHVDTPTPTEAATATATAGAGPGPGPGEIAGAPTGEPPAAGPLRLRAMPTRVPMARFLAAVAAAGGPDHLLAAGRLPVGIGGDGGPEGPCGHGPGWLVLGGPGSGRSTALAVAGRLLLAARQDVIVVARPGSPLGSLTEHGGTVVDPTTTGASCGSEEQADALIEILDRHLTATLVIDEMSDLDGQLDAVLRDRIDHPHVDRWPRRAGPGGGQALVLAGTGPAAAAVAYRGLVPGLRKARTGLLLGMPSPGDGEVLGARCGPRGRFPPGRALALVDGQWHSVQVAEIDAFGPRTAADHAANGPASGGVR